MKIRRQKKILELVEQKVIRTQEELAEALKEAGFDVTQATVSRDIKELGLVKIPFQKDSYRYALPQKTVSAASIERLKRLFADAVSSYDQSENLIVIKTLPGAAQGVASAIDQVAFPEILGTIAGDDTILIIARDREQVPKILARFDEFLT
ncbi:MULTISPECIES: arginine repressor [Carboxydothermus]|uniref:Arginine repressor n=3 Tax=Carboxydothermus TaxID=129957 RepID=ARGR_CARHZ|nr:MULTISPECIES: arginine repressor [Carboxydothermus]Q3AAN4.1 RecName: Full=Arginine repressor [Carboxydothermus hydrogenoformans Z-2901]ABB15734.1 arginine repressor [Carboxydothermus hydrogenoformans Z-2901]NYE58694.1 transcriptional regulator of arginine metabolism [Carboxydothermus ferrireducens DSM 11255]GAV25647.1 arginine repressor [Carboxydothermus islandicus]